MLSCRFRTQTVAPWNWNCNAIRSDNPTRPNKSSQKQGWGSRVGVHTNSRHLLRSQRAAGVQTCTKCHFMSASAPREVFFFFFHIARRLKQVPDQRERVATSNDCFPGNPEVSCLDPRKSDSEQSDDHLTDGNFLVRILAFGTTDSKVPFHGHGKRDVSVHI